MNGTEKQISYAKSLISKAVAQAEESLKINNVDNALETIAEINEEFSNGEITAEERDNDLRCENSVIDNANEIKNIVSVLNNFDCEAATAIEALANINPQQMWQNKEFNAKQLGAIKFWAFINGEVA